jgi:hypothetical protein
MTLKEKLLRPEVMAYPEREDLFILYTDICLVAIEAG